MGQPTQGMNPDEVERLAQELQRVARRIDAWSREIDRFVARTSWIGRDADQFKGTWWPQRRRRLHTIASSLNDYGNVAKRNADDQRRVSSSPGSAAGAGPGVVTVLKMMAAAVETVGVAGLVRKVGVNHQFPLSVNTFKHMITDTGDVNFGTIDNAVYGKIDLNKLKGVGNVLTYVDVAADVPVAIGALADGDYFKFGMTTTGAVVDVVGTKVPYVAAGKLAWDAGRWIGEHLAKTDYNQQLQAGAVERGMLSEYGTTHLTPAQASEFSHRYDGPAGFGRAARDYGKALADKLWF